MQKRAVWFARGLATGVVWLLLAGLVSPGAPAATLERSLADMVRAADGIYRGTVVEKTCSWDDDRTAIFTHYTLRVSEVWLGPAREELTLSERGGEVGGIGLHVPGTPVYRVGEEVVVFTHRHGGRAMTLFWTEGKFSVRAGAAAPRPAGTPTDRPAGTPAHRSAAPEEPVAIQSTGPIAPMTLARLRERVAAIVSEEATP